MQLPLDLGGAVTDGPADASEGHALFRPIHYLGSKLRLAPTIADALDSADAGRGTVLDLFAGSGTTALALAAHRTVIASDIQEYSRVLCSALLTKPAFTADLVAAFEEKVKVSGHLWEKFQDIAEPLLSYERFALQEASRGIGEPICQVIESGSVLAAERAASPTEADELDAALREVQRRMARAQIAGSSSLTAFRYFGGIYFSYEQALELDYLSAVASTFPSEFSDVLTAALLSTASDVVNTVGKQFAQPIRPRNKQGVIKRHLLAKIERDRRQDSRSIFLQWLERYVQGTVSERPHLAVREDYRDALKKLSGRYSVVYADPPYTRDHYSRFYHVLETIARRDNPAIARSPGAGVDDLSRGLYRDDRHQSPFCIKSQCDAAFGDMFQLASQSGANIILSYSPFDETAEAHPRLMRIDALVAMAEQFYKSVELESVTGVAHSKLNHTSLNFGKPDEAEVLLICRLKR
ncbi:DNA adenine methylase [Paraburkholderia agricolaris]|uniref:site-specific DNA-methyltransferase (adenine-specific) n=1 Tax=Paraburkholderia agricolaris TaxID=2152888 RepID=A0ABW8ZQV2_9BURK